MNLWFRLIWVIIAALFRPKIKLTESGVLQFRCMPHDLDTNLHMNNARYIALMDLGRMDMIVRGGMAKHILKNGWQPVVASSLIRYRKPVNLFQAITLHTRLMCWDERWMYIEHRLMRGDVLVCHVVVRGCFVGKDGLVNLNDAVKLSYFPTHSPHMPYWLKEWRDLEDNVSQLPDFT